MNKISRESYTGVMNALGSKQQLCSGRGVTLGEDPKEEDENLDLFSSIRQNHLVVSHNEFNCQNDVREVGSLIVAKSRIDDLLSANNGKHDYDWLLTPPRSPLTSPSRSSDYQPSETASRGNSNIMSASIGKILRPSVSQQDNDTYSRSSRSSSITESSISTSFSSSSYAHSNRRTSVLNTSTDSVTSRPSTPGSRPTSRSSSRAAIVPPARSAPGRSATPTKYRSSVAAHGDKPKVGMSSRPSTPTSRAQTHSSSLNPRTTGPPARSSSRPSTPTRRMPTITPASSRVHSTSVNNVAASNNQNVRPSSRPSSPAPRAQPQSKLLVVLPDFPLDTPANLRTKLPERAVSAGRQRPGLALTVRPNLNSESTNPVSSNRRQSASPTVTRGRLQENTPTTRSNIMFDVRSSNKKPAAVESTVRRSIKASSQGECNGFGRTISKYSMDMALKHMDIRQTVGNIRGASLIPQSIRSLSLGQPGYSSGPTAATIGKLVVSSTDDNGMVDTTVLHNDRSGLISRGCNSTVSSNGTIAARPPDKFTSGRITEMNIDDSFSLLKGDSNSTKWLHSVEDNLI